MIEHITPIVAALASCAMVVLVSNSFVDHNRFYFQASIFAVGLAASLSYLITKEDTLIAFMKAFSDLPQELRLCLSIFVITVTYFGGALYVGVVSPAAATADPFPASCDNIVDFEVPADIPADDTKMFEQVFKK
jgi:hypothetical protein